MRKSIAAAFAMVLCTFVFLPAASEAGNFMVGVKGWYTIWDSAFLKWFEDDIALYFMENGLPLSSKKDPGSGYLAGPYISYQTDDGKWAFSIAAMVFSSFSQDWSGTAGAMALRSDIKVDRKDFDIAVNYTIFKYMKAFVGYKHQIIDMDFNLSYITMMGPRSFKYKLDSMVMMPTAGIGLAYPILQNFVIGLQLGALYAVPSLKMTDENTNQTFDIWPRPSPGFNGEFALYYQPIESIVIQLGYRYQIFTLEARHPERWEKTVAYDINHGVTLALVYVFDPFRIFFSK